MEIIGRGKVEQATTMKKQLIVIGICLFSAACQRSAQENQTQDGGASPAVDENKTTVVFLVDISQSFAPLTKEDRDALNIIITDVVALTQNTWEPPITF